MRASSWPLSFSPLCMAPGLIQTVSELWYGEQPRALDIFVHPPTARNLHEYEQSLEQTNLVVKQAPAEDPVSSVEDSY